MAFLKAVTIITIWMLLSFFWVSLGQTKNVDCFNYDQVESWMKDHSVVKEWFDYYVDRNACAVNEEEFFKTLASSEPLSTKLNQAKVKFDQFYVPISNLLGVDWDSVADRESQSIHSDLLLIDHSLREVLRKMDSADQDHFRATVLLGFPTDFGMKHKKSSSGPKVSRRLNRENQYQKHIIHYKDVSPPPYERVFR